MPARHRFRVAAKSSARMPAHGHRSRDCPVITSEYAESDPGRWPERAALAELLDNRQLTLDPPGNIYLMRDRGTIRKVAVQ